MTGSSSDFPSSGAAHRRNKQQAQWIEVQAARAEYLRISEQLDSIVRDQTQFGSTGMQHPNGLQIISKLGKQRAFAFEKYRAKLAAYHDVVCGQSSPVPYSSGDDLTPREREVLALIAKGKTSKQVAEELGISFKTVVCHRDHIMSKLDTHNTADLTRAAIRLGLVDIG
jgi:DNA-binding NarL/FixJ family response regulator